MRTGDGAGSSAASDSIGKTIQSGCFLMLVHCFGVEVVCKGDNACTDGQGIRLPSMAAPLDDGLERMMLGYLPFFLSSLVIADPLPVLRVLHVRCPSRP